MALARWKDLCIDAVDAPRLGRFWADVLGLELVLLDDGDARLVGPTPFHTVWINTVPEPKAVKHRVHLDVHAGSVAEVLAKGASPAPSDPSWGWTVVRDPEGGELCVFVRDEPPALRLYEIAVDAADPEAQARWWAALLDADIGHEEGNDWWWVDGVDDAPFDGISFVAVPEPKTVKNRIHVDLVVPDLAAVIAHGATVLRPEGGDIGWTVMADPEGNEWCAFREPSTGG